jgi:O-antigen ligase
MGQSDLWRSTYFLALIPMTGFIVWRRMEHPLAALLWVYALVSCLCQFQNPWAALPFPAEPSFATLLDQTSGQAFAQLLVIPLFVISCSPRLFRHWKWFFIVAALANALACVLFPYGIFAARSLDASFVAVVFPVMPIWALVVTAPIIVYSSTAIGIGAAQVLGYFIARRKWIICALGILAVSVAGILLQGRDLLNSNLRLEVWTAMMTWWWERDAHVIWFGTGVGTFQWISPAVYQLNHHVWLQMHSDWLQALFEMGVVGTALLLAFYVQTLVRAFNRPRLFAMVLGYGAFMATYHPAHYFFSALLGVCLARAVHEDLS